MEDNDQTYQHIILKKGKGKWWNLSTFKEVEEYVEQVKKGCPLCGSHKLSLLIIPVEPISSEAVIICLNGCDNHIDITNRDKRKCKFERNISDYDMW